MAANNFGSVKVKYEDHCRHTYLKNRTTDTLEGFHSDLANALNCFKRYKNWVTN